MNKGKYLRSALFLLIIIFSSCETYKLELKLSPKFREWYEIHSILMNIKIPWWIDEGKPYERLYFLRLSDELKKEYIKVFWQIRQPGADELFYGRLDFVNKAFDGEGIPGWKTDRGQIVLLCGFPDIEQCFYQGEFSFPLEGQLNSDYKLVWRYCQGMMYASYTFCFEFPHTWRKCDSSIVSMSGQIDLERHWREVFEPTESGWDAWLSIIMK